MLRPFPSSMRAAAITPAEPVGACVARFPTGASLPRFCGGSASALHVSRPAQRLLALRPAWSLSRPWRPVTSECFRRCRYLHHPLRLLPAGTTVAGRDSHPLGNGALHGAHRKLCQAWLQLLSGVTQGSQLALRHGLRQHKGVSSLKIEVSVNQGRQPRYVFRVDCVADARQLFESRCHVEGIPIRPLSIQTRRLELAPDGLGWTRASPRSSQGIRWSSGAWAAWGLGLTDGREPGPGLRAWQYWLPLVQQGRAK